MRGVSGVDNGRLPRNYGSSSFPRIIYLYALPTRYAATPYVDVAMLATTSIAYRNNRWKGGDMIRQNGETGIREERVEASERESY